MRHKICLFWFVILFFATTSMLQAAEKKIYYGDLHVHTNLSGDAVLVQVLQGIDRGPEMVCEYARACAGLDFFGHSDHAEMIDSEGWERTKNAVKACNASAAAEAGAGEDPAVVALTGFEWTSSSTGLHWGHKNVFFRNDVVPEKPVAANVISEIGVVNLNSALNTLKTLKRYRDHIGFGSAVKAFKKGSDRMKLVRCKNGEPYDCIRVADEPRQLFAILNSYYRNPLFVEGGYDAMVIPHGTAWGMAKVGTDWDIQLNPDQQDANLQRLIEIYSGHGNSEEYRDFSDPESGYESCFVRAGKLAFQHCRKKGGEPQTCVKDAQKAATDGRVSFKTKAEDWGMCGECPDCFKPAERYQTKGSVQAALAMSHFDAKGKPDLRYQFGIIGSTDDHSARPGSVKERRRLADWGLGAAFPGAAESPFAPAGRNVIEAERVGSFFYPGGLVAVHAESRTREAIWQALKRREVFGTSGPRLALWFRAVTGESIVNMGSRLTATTAPRFEVEVWGAPESKPGCSPRTWKRWGRDVVQNVCMEACYNPGARRVGIDRIEVVRIRPQISADEKLGDLIDDPFLVIKNPNHNRQGRASARMTATFTDPEFASLGRDALYYVRAIQEPTPAVNGQPMRKINGRWHTCPVFDTSDDCLSLAEERAWSSPIWLDARTR